VDDPVDRHELIQKRGEALALLVESHLPLEVNVTGDHDAWPLISAGLLSRMTTTLRHIMDLAPRGQGVDAGTLLRSLYEHLVHFAWLAADPSRARIEEWHKNDLRMRLAADDDARRRGVPLYSDQQRAEFQRQVAAMTGRPLKLEQLAEAADKAWDGRLEAIGLGSASQPKSFRGLYAFVYRNYSAGAHPSLRGLNPVVEDVTVTRKRIVVEGPYDGSGPYGLATVLYAVALYVAAAALQWPDTDDVEAVFERYPW
jgi:hypothetical protein